VQIKRVQHSLKNYFKKIEQALPSADDKAQKNF
jgi:hypothetical protein